MFIKNKTRIFLLVLCLCLLFSCFSIGFAGEWDLPKILSNNSFTMTKSCPAGSEVTFSADEFKQNFQEAGLNLKGIIVTSLPSPETGKLYLGNAEVKIFDAVALSKVDRMVFRSNFGAVSDVAQFHYKGYDNHDFFDINSQVTLKFTDEMAALPTVQDITTATMRDLSLNGFFKGDSNQSLVYVIESQPKLGELILSPTGNGFSYIPNLGKSGQDSFTYYATDADGNRSAPAMVSVDIKNSKNPTTYADMATHWANHSAVMLADRAIITGERIGNDHFFYPDTPITKADFTVMLMSTCGLANTLPEVVTTGLVDDAQIPEFLKKYVSHAMEMGIITGEPAQDGLRFNGNALITRAQAFKMMDAALSLPSIATFSNTYEDHDTIPIWATQPIINLEGLGIIRGYDDNTIRPASTITKAQAAQLLCQIMLYEEAQKPVSHSVSSFVLNWFK